MEWRGGGGGLLADLAGLPSRRRRERERRLRVESVLESFGLIEVRHQLAGSLPIGQARLVELARALADRSSLVLLDEPTSGLSRREIECLAGHVARLRREHVAAVLVEHDVGFVMDQSDRVIVLNLGRVLAEGSPEAIQADPRVRETYLG
jgi:branched-chain amino acid transport system ATP-binding protein